MRYIIVNSVLAAILWAGHAGAAPAPNAPQNPWDSQAEPSGKAPAKAPGAQVTRSKKTAAEPSKRSPFGAPVPAQQATLRWGDPIALTPSHAASAPSPGSSAPAPAPAASAVATAASAPAAARAASAAVEQPADRAETSWKLVRGIALHTQLQRWANIAGWQLEWKLNRSWIVPADVKLVGTFDQALEQVISALAGEGKPINLILWEGNHVAEVNETGAR